MIQNSRTTDPNFEWTFTKKFSQHTFMHFLIPKVSLQYFTFKIISMIKANIYIYFKNRILESVSKIHPIFQRHRTWLNVKENRLFCMKFNLISLYTSSISLVLSFVFSLSRIFLYLILLRLRKIMEFQCDDGTVVAHTKPKSPSGENVIWFNTRLEYTFVKIALRMIDFDSQLLPHRLSLYIDPYKSIYYY